MDASKQMTGQCGQGVCHCADLENGSPRGADVLSSQSVNLLGTVKFKPVEHAQIRTLSGELAGFNGGVANDDAAKLAGCVEKADGVATSGEGVIGFFINDGDYFVVEGNRVYVLDSDALQGVAPDEKSRVYFAAIAQYFAKYVLKGLPA